MRGPNPLRADWPKDEPEKAASRCEHCSNLIADWQKYSSVRAGEWCAARPEISHVADAAAER